MPTFEHLFGPDLPEPYRTIFRRRDVRAHFTGGEIAPEVLQRVLFAAHAAPSVGLSQPWDFLIVTSMAKRTSFQAHVSAEREKFSACLPLDEKVLFSRIKIEGILESSLGILVTYDPSRAAPHVLGRHTIPDTGLYSVCLAIENLWLAATAENLGVGWVSFYQEEFVRNLFGIPAHIRPVAWLCLGPVHSFADIPDLERHQWRARRPLDTVLHRESWGKKTEESPICGENLTHAPTGDRPQSPHSAQENVAGCSPLPDSSDANKPA